MPPAGFYDPRNDGGAFLTEISPGSDLGEPLNMIISGNSDPDVLVDQAISGGLRNYFLSLHFSSECLGQHEGDPQTANLGDGNGFLNETAVIRWNYYDPSLGTCKETIQGGNHFRYWVQNGAAANSGAVFMACSYEKPIAQAHDIVVNGYNLGRDYIIGNLTNTTVPTLTLKPNDTWSGDTSAGGYTYHTDVTWVGGLLQNTSVGVNHASTVSTPETNATDGLVAVMVVKITNRPPNSAASLRLDNRLLRTIPFGLVLFVSFLLSPICL